MVGVVMVIAAILPREREKLLVIKSLFGKDRKYVLTHGTDCQN